MKVRAVLRSKNKMTRATPDDKLEQLLQEYELTPQPKQKYDKINRFMAHIGKYTDFDKYPKLTSLQVCPSVSQLDRKHCDCTAFRDRDGV